MAAVTVRTKLPVTVTAVQPAGNQLWGVTVAYSDGTTQTWLIPETMATIQAVTWAAAALAVIADLDVNQIGRFNPLTGLYGTGKP